MTFLLNEARAVLERTPHTLRALLQGLPDGWIHADEGPDTFSPLDELRRESLVALDARDLSAADLDRRGRHPEFGPVSARELLATWVVHDLGHVAQVTRAMAGRYRATVGPWAAYLPVLARRVAGDSRNP